MKITISDFKDWYDNDPIWIGDEYYIEHEGAEGIIFNEDGEIIMRDDEIVDISDMGMFLCHQDTGDVLEVLPLIRKFLKNRDTETIVLTVNKKEKERVIQLLKENKINFKK